MGRQGMIGVLLVRVRQRVGPLLAQQEVLDELGGRGGLDGVYFGVWLVLLLYIPWPNPPRLREFRFLNPIYTRPRPSFPPQHPTCAHMSCTRTPTHLDGAGLAYAHAEQPAGEEHAVPDNQQRLDWDWHG